MHIWSYPKIRSFQKAFTVQELLVTMVVSSLVMGMVYAIYLQLHKQLYAFSEYGQQQMEYNQFKTELASDVFFAKSMKEQGQNGLILGFEEENREYLFLGDMVVWFRQDELRDTFAIETLSYEVEKKLDHIFLKLSIKMAGQSLFLFEAKEIQVADQINQMYGH